MTAAAAHKFKRGDRVRFNASTLNSGVFSWMANAHVREGVIKVLNKNGDVQVHWDDWVDWKAKMTQTLSHRRLVHARQETV